MKSHLQPKQRASLNLFLAWGSFNRCSRTIFEKLKDHVVEIFGHICETSADGSKWRHISPSGSNEASLQECHPHCTTRTVHSAVLPIRCETPTPCRYLLQAAMPFLCVSGVFPAWQSLHLDPYRVPNAFVVLHAWVWIRDDQSTSSKPCFTWRTVLSCRNYLVGIWMDLVGSWFLHFLFCVTLSVWSQRHLESWHASFCKLSETSNMSVLSSFSNKTNQT